MLEGNCHSLVELSDARFLLDPWNMGHGGNISIRHHSWLWSNGLERRSSLDLQGKV